jgi:Tfp pilus assembly protein PilO
MRTIVPILLIIVAIGAFFAYVDPTYAKIKALKQEEAQYDEALTKSRELQAIRDRLLSKFNTFSTTDLERLEKLLPDNVDNVRLIMDIASIAAKYGMTIKNVSIKEVAPQKDAGIVGPDEKNYGSIGLDFSISSTYNNFVQFIMDLEQSLRIVDITSISFRSGEADLYEYNLGVRTYWLK